MLLISEQNILPLSNFKESVIIKQRRISMHVNILWMVKSLIYQKALCTITKNGNIPHKHHLEFCICRIKHDQIPGFLANPKRNSDKFAFKTETRYEINEKFWLKSNLTNYNLESSRFRKINHEPYCKKYAVMQLRKI